MDYAVLRAIHVTAVVLSVGGFLLRFGLRLAGSRGLHGRIARTAPHVIDTVLLASAVAMVWIAWPGVPGWIRAKLAGLLVYIVAGSFALKRAQGPLAVATSFAVALAAIAWIVAAAFTKNPWGLLAAFG